MAPYGGSVDIGAAATRTDALARRVEAAASGPASLTIMGDIGLKP
jgi:hypothetical protein